MTVNLKGFDGKETMLHLSMSTVVTLSTTLIIAIVTGLFMFIYGMNTALQSHVELTNAKLAAQELKIAVIEQVNISQGEAFTEIKEDMKVIKSKVQILPAIRNDQVRREKKGW
jgi:hypothetical protein